MNDLRTYDPGPEEEGGRLMETIASDVRRMFLAIMQDEIIKLQDRAETLKDAELFDAELKAQLTSIYEALFKARCRCEDLLERRS